MLKNWVIYLVGPPGVGKLTVARELARIAGCKVIDNHYWLNPIFGLIRQDGITPLPAAIWPLVAQVRQAVLATVADLSPADLSYVFTHAATGDPEDQAADAAICGEIARAAQRRGARMLAVRLICAPDELARRVAAPERRRMMKEVDVAAARANAVAPPFDPGWPETMTIDTSNLLAAQTAEHILARVRSLELTT